MLTIRIVHEHVHRLNRKDYEKLMAISTELQAQLDRLSSYVSSLKGGAAAQAQEDLAAVASALDAAGAPPAPPAGDPQPPA